MLLLRRVLYRFFKYLTRESIDVELSNKLAEELRLEGSMDEGMEIPPSIQEYLEKGPFKVPLSNSERLIYSRYKISPAQTKS